MRLQDWHSEPLHEIPCRTAAGDGRGAIVTSIALTCADVEGLPPSLDALLVTSDLQSREMPRSKGHPARLIGETLAEELALLAQLEALSLDPARTGVLLCGDLFATPGADERGASGDVRPVWQAFIDAGSRWVCGIAGNHDRFGDSDGDRLAFAAMTGIHYLDDGETITLDGLRVAGIGGILGRQDKALRRSEGDWTRALRRAIGERPNILLLHEGPDVPAAGLRGSAFLRAALEALPTRVVASGLLVLCGHCHWDVPLHELANGVQVFNADTRVVLLRRRRATDPPALAR